MANWPDSTECGTTSVKAIQAAPGWDSSRYFGQFAWNSALLFR
jgi:hypothetical protein